MPRIESDRWGSRLMARVVLAMLSASLASVALGDPSLQVVRSRVRARDSRPGSPSDSRRLPTPGRRPCPGGPLGNRPTDGLRRALPRHTVQDPVERCRPHRRHRRHGQADPARRSRRCLADTGQRRPLTDQRRERADSRQGRRLPGEGVARTARTRAADPCVCCWTGSAGRVLPCRWIV
jgi:hypothetical protein